MAENISFNTESLGAPVDTLSYEQARAELENVAPTVAPWGEIWTGFSTGAESVTVSAGPTGSSGRTDTSEQ